MGRPVKVTAHLAEPVAGDPPHLDALLEHVMARHAKRIEKHDRRRHHQGIQGVPSRQRSAGPVGRIPIPIERGEIGGHPVARCSSPIYATSGESAPRMAQRLSHLEVADLLALDQVRTIHHGSGSTRAQYKPIRLLHIDRVVWFAVAYGGPRKARNGDNGRPARRSPLSELRRRLRKIPAIGKHTGHGFGRVAKWEVEAVDHDLSWYAPSDLGMVLMRELPADADHPDGIVGARRQRRAVCPPYWHPERLVNALVPC